MRKTKAYSILRIMGVLALLATSLVVTAVPAPAAVTGVVFAPATITYANGTGTGTLDNGYAYRVTVTVAGTHFITLPAGASGSIPAGGPIASAVTLQPGRNVVTSSALGTFAITVSGAANGVQGYAVAFFTATGQLAAADNITIVFAAGTTMPAGNPTLTAANVKINGATCGSAAVTTATRTVLINVGATAAAVLASGPPLGVTVTIAPESTTAASIMNPATAANYQGTVETTDDAGAVTSAAYTIRSNAIASNYDVGITHKGTEYVASSTGPTPTVKPNVVMVQVGDALTIRSLGGGSGNGPTDTDLTFANIYYAAGTGSWVQGAAVTAKIEGNPVTIAPVGATVGTGVTGDPGKGKFLISLVVPSLNGSSNFEKVTYTGDDQLVEVSDGTNKVQFSIWVVPKATFTPYSAKTGTTITVTGSGFTGGRGITIYWGGNLETGGIPLTATVAAAPNAGTLALSTAVSTGAITTLSDGTFSGTFKSLAGTKYISAVDGDGNWVLKAARAVDETAFTYAGLGTVTVSPTTGKPGDTVTLQLSDFTATTGTLVKLWFGYDAAVYADATPDRTLSDNTLDANGGITSATFTVPTTTAGGQTTLPGAYLIRVRDFNNVGGTTTFTVGALGMTTDVSSVSRYQKVTIRVSGMSGTTNNWIAPNAVTLGGNAWNAATNSALFVAGFDTGTPGKINLDASGSATFTIRVPDGIVGTQPTIGSNELRITDAGGRTAIGTLTVINPTISLSPASQVRGGLVTVTGTGWVPDESVRVTLTAAGSAATTSFSATPGATGGFLGALTVPTGTAWTSDSSNTVAATDDHNNTSATVILKIPAAAITVTPTVAKWGTEVTVKGTGFRGGMTIRCTIPWDPSGTAANVFPTAVYTDSAGAFEGKFILPSIEKGIQSVGASDGSVNATATIEVQEAPPTVAAALSTIAGKYTAVWNYDAKAGAWLKYDPAAPAYANTLTTLTDGAAYWVVATEDCTVTYGAKVRTLYKGPNNIGW